MIVKRIDEERFTFNQKDACLSTLLHIYEQERWKRLIPEYGGVKHQQMPGNNDEYSVGYKPREKLNHERRRIY